MVPISPLAVVTWIAYYIMSGSTIIAWTRMRSMDNQHMDSFIGLTCMSSQRSVSQVQIVFPGCNTSATATLYAVPVFLQNEASATFLQLTLLTVHCAIPCESC